MTSPFSDELQDQLDDAHPDLYDHFLKEIESEGKLNWKNPRERALIEYTINRKISEKLYEDAMAR